MALCSEDITMKCFIVVAYTCIFSSSAWDYSGGVDPNDYEGSNEFFGSSELIHRGETVFSTKEHPYMALIEHESRPLCWGAMISRGWTISVASCTKGKPSKKLSVRVGFTSLKDGQSRPVAEKFEHPEFDDDTDYNDIVLLQILFGVTLYNFKKIYVASERPTDSAVGFTAIQTSEFCPWSWCGGEGLDIALTTLNVTMHDHCSNYDFDEELQLCLKAVVKPTEPKYCRFGTRGTPFVIKNKLYGLLSSGDICSSTAVYTDISKYTDYITKVTNIKPKPRIT